MALNNMGLGFVFTARDMASATMQRIQGNLARTGAMAKTSGVSMQRGFAALGAGLAVAAAGAAAIGVGVAAANQYGAFEQSLASVGAVTKATTTELDLLRTAALDAGMATQFSPDEATQGLLSLATAGQTATQSTKTLIPVLDLAAGSLGQLGVAEAAEAVVGTLNAFGKTADEAAGVTDKLLRITQLSNFQTRDFAAGLSKAAAAGATFDQDLNNILISMGLLRNRNIDASSSATAFRESIRRLGSDQNAQKAITEAGVDIFDQTTGKMRDLIDITMDFAAATKDMSDKERNAAIVRAYGARGLLAYNAISKATFTKTFKDGTSEVLRGRDAIAEMRTEMANAGGTAASFRGKLLDTYEGQKTLIRGSLQTLGVVTGEAFAKAFKPILSIGITAINWLIAAIKKIPGPVKTTIVAILGVVGALATFLGSGVAIGAAIALLIPALKVIAIVLGVITVAMAPVIAVFAALAGVAYMFKLAFDANVGGIADKVSGWFGKIRLAYDALNELFTRGGFSKSLLEDLNKSENSGIKQFVIKLFVLGNQIRKFAESIGEGFKAMIGGAGPAFKELSGEVNVLLSRFGFLGSDNNVDKQRSRTERFAEAGRKVGRIIGIVGIAIVRAMTWAAAAVTTGIDAWNRYKGILSPITDTVRQTANSFKAVGQAFEDAGLGGASSFSLLTHWIKLVAISILRVAKVVGFVAQLIASNFASIVQIVSAVVQTIVGVVSGQIRMIKAVLAGDWAGAWEAAKDVVFVVARGIIKAVIAMVAAVAGAIDALGGVLGKDLGLRVKVDAAGRVMDKAFHNQIGAEDAKRLGLPTPNEPGIPTKEPGTEATKAEPATRELSSGLKRLLAAKGGEGEGLGGLPALAGAGAGAGGGVSAEHFASLEAAVRSISGQPISLNATFEVDGDEIAGVNTRVNRNGEALGATPGGVPG